VNQDGDDDQDHRETSRCRRPRPQPSRSTDAATPCPASASQSAAGAGGRIVADAEQQSLPTGRPIRRFHRGELSPVLGSGSVTRARRRVLNRLAAVGDLRCGHGDVAGHRVTGVGRIVGGKQVRGSVKHQQR
jgi:hypothetical protein